MTILMVDDDPDFMGIVGNVLAEDGHQTIQILDPEEALAKIRARELRFSVAIVDKAIKPNSGRYTEDDFPDPRRFQRIGLELVQVLHDSYRGTPVIFLSSFLDQQDARELEDNTHVHRLDKVKLNFKYLPLLIRRLL